jgi:hypothetical protein
MAKLAVIILRLSYILCGSELRTGITKSGVAHGPKE